MPPMIVYKTLKLNDNWTHLVHANSWFDMNLFETLLFKIVLLHVEATRNLEDTVLLGDNLAYHFSPKSNH